MRRVVLFLALGTGIIVLGVGVLYVWILILYDQDFSRFYLPTDVAEAAETGVLIRELRTGEVSVWGDDSGLRL